MKILDQKRREIEEKKKALHEKLKKWNRKVDELNEEACLSDSIFNNNSKVCPKRKQKN